MEAWHGTLDGYTNHDCRCQPCKDAHAAYQRKRLKERREHTRIYGAPPEIKHGYYGWRNWGCRCHICFQASKDHNRSRTNRRRGKDDHAA